MPASYACPDQTRLQRLIDARHPCISIVTQEEQYASDLLHAIALGNPQPLWCWTVIRGIYAARLRMPVHCPIQKILPPHFFTLPTRSANHAFA